MTFENWLDKSFEIIIRYSNFFDRNNPHFAVFDLAFYFIPKVDVAFLYYKSRSRIITNSQRRSLTFRFRFCKRRGRAAPSEAPMAQRPTHSHSTTKKASPSLGNPFSNSW